RCSCGGRAFHRFQCNQQRSAVGFIKSQAGSSQGDRQAQLSLESDVARSPRTHPTRTIGLIVPDITNPYYREMAQAVEEASFEHGYTVILAHQPSPGSGASLFSSARL